MNDIENSAVNLDGSENVGTQGIEESNSEAAKAMKKLKDARDKDGGQEHSDGKGGGVVGRVAKFIGDSDRGRDR